MPNRILRFVVTIRADVTPLQGETQEEADAATAKDLLPGLTRSLERNMAFRAGGAVTFDSSSERG